MTIPTVLRRGFYFGYHPFVDLRNQLRAGTNDDDERKITKAAVSSKDDLRLSGHGEDFTAGLALSMYCEMLETVLVNLNLRHEGPKNGNVRPSDVWFVNKGLSASSSVRSLGMQLNACKHVKAGFTDDLVKSMNLGGF